MKKLFTILFLLAFALSVTAQRSGSTTTLLPQQTYKALTMTAADTVHTTSYWVFALNKPATQYFAFAVAVDSMPLTTKQHVWFDVLGSVDGVVYVTTGATTVKYGSTIDSTFSLVDVSTGVLWRYLKLQAVAKTGTFKGPKITAISMKVGNK